MNRRLDICEGSAFKHSIHCDDLVEGLKKRYGLMLLDLMLLRLAPRQSIYHLAANESGVAGHHLCVHSEYLLRVVIVVEDVLKSHAFYNGGR